MEPLIDARIREWSNKLDETFVKTGEPFDFAWWAVYVALYLTMHIFEKNY